MISLPSVPSLLLVLGIKMKLDTAGTSLEGVNTNPDFNDMLVNSLLKSDWSSKLVIIEVLYVFDKRAGQTSKPDTTIFSTTQNASVFE